MTYNEKNIGKIEGKGNDNDNKKNERNGKKRLGPEKKMTLY